MIVGIDETGDFDSNSDKYNYFVAVLIDQNDNRYKIKESQFRVWESSIPKANRDEKGEAKGQKLTDSQLEDFYNQVLKPNPIVLYSVVRFDASKNSKELLEEHKKIEINRLEQALAHYKEEARGNWADWYNKLIGWYKNRNYQHLIKIKCLQNLIGQTFNHGFAWSQIKYILDKDDSNIKNFGFKIDKDFVNAENTKIMWTELLRQFWADFSKLKPLPLIDIADKEKYPEIEHYKFDKGKSNLKKVFRDRTHFLTSEEHFEIRMADIVGTILHRFQNKGRCKEIAEKILSHLGGKRENYIELILNDLK